MSSSISGVSTRKWCFTVNNYTDEDLDFIETFSPRCSYLAYSKEVGESKTPHLQGFFVCKSACTMTALKKSLPRAHLEVMKGSVDDSVAYCSKENPLEEFGTRPKGAGQAEKKRWDLAWAAAREGRMDDIPSDIKYRYYRTTKEICKDHMQTPPDADGTTGLWFYGASGAGKSRTARERYPGSYLKMANKWWDGYQDQETVIIDDVDTKHDCLGHHLKIWADRYAFLAETKGGAICIRPKLIIITSQYRIDEIWFDEETREALKRRFQVTRFGGISEEGAFY